MHIRDEDAVCICAVLFFLADTGLIAGWHGVGIAAGKRFRLLASYRIISDTVSMLFCVCP
jgi:hypothetical protein